MKLKGYDWSNKKVLVTGAGGFKGSYLCAALNMIGAQVYGTVRDHIHPGSAYEMLDLDENITKEVVDITDRQSVYDTINTVEPDVIFHLAAKALVPSSLRDPRRAFDVNIMGTLNIIEACRKLGIGEKMLICSTDHVFGSTDPKDLPERGYEEKNPVNFGGPYDTSKAAMELLVRSYNTTYLDEVPALGITRCANVFGYGDINARRVVPLFVSSAVNGNDIYLKYLKNGRQFIHITDAITGYILAASHLDKANNVEITPTFHFAIENYEGTTNPYIEMRSLAQLVASLFNVTINKKEAVDYADKENKVQALSCQQTRDLLGWKVDKPMDIAITELSEWYSHRNNKRMLKQLISQDVSHIADQLGCM